MGGMPAEGTYVLIARVGTIYYFLHFLVILPLLSSVEKTDPVPASISAVSYTHLRAHETSLPRVCRLLLEKIIKNISKAKRSLMVI